MKRVHLFPHIHVAVLAKFQQPLRSKEPAASATERMDQPDYNADIPISPAPTLPSKTRSYVSHLRTAVHSRLGRHRKSPQDRDYIWHAPYAQPDPPISEEDETMEALTRENTAKNRGRPRDIVVLEANDGIRAGPPQDVLPHQLPSHQRRYAQEPAIAPAELPDPPTPAKEPDFAASTLSDISAGDARRPVPGEKEPGEPAADVAHTGGRVAAVGMPGEWPEEERPIHPPRAIRRMRKRGNLRAEEEESHEMPKTAESSTAGTRTPDVEVIQTVFPVQKTERVPLPGILVVNRRKRKNKHKWRVRWAEGTKWHSLHRVLVVPLEEASSGNGVEEERDVHEEFPELELVRRPSMVMERPPSVVLIQNIPPGDYFSGFSEFSQPETLMVMPEPEEVEEDHQAEPQAPEERVDQDLAQHLGEELVRHKKNRMEKRYRRRPFCLF